MTHETRVTRLHVVRTGEPIFDESATAVEVTDDSSGEHVKVQQFGIGTKAGTIFIDPTEWPTLRKAIDRMVRECRQENSTSAE